MNFLTFHFILYMLPEKWWWWWGGGLTTPGLFTFKMFYEKCILRGKGGQLLLTPSFHDATCLCNAMQMTVRKEEEFTYLLIANFRFFDSTKLF